jgi:hypothetical protein
MENAFKVANLDNDKQVIEKITVLENELTVKTGKKIVLIAYDK